MLKIIKYSSKNLLELINDILDISKIEAGKIELSYTKVVTRQLFNELYLMFLDIKRKKKLNLNYKIYDRVPDVIIADELRVKQIIINLLSNSFKFTEKGYVGLSIDYQENDLIILVEDTGIGIAKNKQKKIFESFSQEDSSTSRKYGGTGLGLTITKKLVELMKGKIKFTSEKGEGTKFEIKLPFTKSTIDEDLMGEVLLSSWIKDPELEELIITALSTLSKRVEKLEKAISNKDEETIKFLSHKLAGTYGNLGVDQVYEEAKKINAEIIKESPDFELIENGLRELKNIESLIPTTYIKSKKIENKSKEEELLLSNYKILVAEDSEYNQILIKKILKKASLNCKIVENGEEAIREAKKIKYDMFIFDMHMPKLTGDKALQEIKKDKEMENAISIILTADISKEMKEKLERVGFDEYILKPIDKEKFLDIIVNYVSKKETQNKRKSYDIEKVNQLIESLEENVAIFDPEEIIEKANQIDDKDESLKEIKEKLYEIANNFDDEGLSVLIKTLKDFIKD